jgi:hypothetical protein
MATAALMTIAIGDTYLENWKRYCAAGWQSYAARHGLDVVVITEPLVPSSRHPSWQKCLVPSTETARRYSRIVVLDCDIAVNPEAPNIFDQVPQEFVGGVLCGSHIHHDLQHVLLSLVLKRPIPYEQVKQAARERNDSAYRLNGCEPHAEGVVQCGVLVLTPAIHASMFSAAWSRQVPVETRCYEQLPLSHELLSAGAFRQIDTRFNSVLWETLQVHHPYVFEDLPSGEEVVRAIVRSEFANNFFLHFAYEKLDLMQFLGRSTE